MIMCLLSILILLDPIAQIVNDVAQHRVGQHNAAIED